MNVIPGARLRILVNNPGTYSKLGIRYSKGQLTPTLHCLQQTILIVLLVVFIFRLHNN